MTSPLEKTPTGGQAREAKMKGVMKMRMRIAELELDVLLTRREREAIELVAAGWKYKEIAAELSIVPRTAKMHARKAMDKLGVEDRHELFCRLMA